MTWRPLVALLALAACGPSSMPPPRIVVFNPARMLASDAAWMQVQLEAVLPFAVDLNHTLASVDPRASLEIGTRALAASEIDAGSRIFALVPSMFTPGAYDVTVRLIDGRAAVAPGGFVVEPGQWPDSYEFSPIANQRAGEPFLVTIRAVLGGATDTAFHGTVNLSSSHGTLEPATTSPFDAGLVTERLVTIEQTSGNVTLTATDIDGRTGTSNTFLVLPP